MRITIITSIVAAAIVLGLPAEAVEIDHARVLVNKTALTGGRGTFACYCYDAARDVYWTGLFGYGGGFRKVWKENPDDPDSWTSGYELTIDGYTYTNISDVTSSNVLRFIRSSDVPGGVTNADDQGSSTVCGLLLNPAALTIDEIDYGPGELAFITDHGSEVRDTSAGGARRLDWTKKVYRWDLRAIGFETDRQPDRANAQDGVGNVYVPPLGGAGIADWNDVFTVVFTEEDLRNAYHEKTGETSDPGATENFGRQFAWATDGQSLYCIDSGNELGGLYKINASDGAGKLLYSEPSVYTEGPDPYKLKNVISEPAVMHTSVLDFGTGTGDQVLFDGTQSGGNPGGIMYIVDTGTTVSAPHVLIDGVEFNNYAELPLDDEGRLAGSVRSIATDPNGNVYFYMTKNGGLHMRDPQGRFYCVLNKAQQYEVAETHDGKRSAGGGMLRLQTREEDGQTIVTYRGDNSFIGSLRIYDPGDFDRDDGLDQGDRDFMISQYKSTCYETFPDPNNPGTDEFVDYIKADINGSSNPDYKMGGVMADGAVVTMADVEVLGQFFELQLGDFDWDGEALGQDDWNIFYASYDRTRQDVGGTGIWSWFDGDVWGPDCVPDGLVDIHDLNHLNEIPEPGTLALLIVGVLSLAGFFTYSVTQRRLQ